MGGREGEGHEGREKNFDSQIESESKMKANVKLKSAIDKIWCLLKDTQRYWSGLLHEQEWTEEEEKLSSLAERA